MRAMHADPEFKEKHAERMRAMNADPEFKEKHAERMRAMNADPEFKEKHAERMRAMHADPEFKEKHAERMRAMHADPEFKEKHAERMRAMNADPEFKEKLRKISAERMRASSPLAVLTKEQREEYDILVKKGGYKREEALALISERPTRIEKDFVPENIKHHGFRKKSKPIIYIPILSMDFSSDDLEMGNL
jgi:hypothetical protein